MMDKIRFSIDIHAPRAAVWKALWGDETFREWTRAFTGEAEGTSYIQSDWREGGQFEFFEGEASSYGMIEKLTPPETVTFRHVGERRGGKEYPFDADRLETYRLVERDGVTTLTLEQDIPGEYKSLFEEATPQAFASLKELVEKTKA